MPDLSAGFDVPNPFGLLASDFGFDLDGYSNALKFLSDLASGTLETEALELNGGMTADLRGWERNQKFRRVLAKCRQAGADERQHVAQDEAQATSDPEPFPGAQRSIPWDEAPVVRGSAFSGAPDAARLP